MKKNGFTLVEMLAVIIIISFLIVLLIPGYLSIYTSIKRNSYDTKISEIETAAKKYGNKIKDEVKASTCIDLTVEQLIERGELISESDSRAEMYNPTNGAVLNGVVKVCYSKEKLDLIANYVEPYNPNVYYHKGEKVIYNNRMYECIEDAPPGNLYSNYTWTTTTTTQTTRIGGTTSPTTSLATSQAQNTKYFKEITY